VHPLSLKIDFETGLWCCKFAKFQRLPPRSEGVRLLRSSLTRLTRLSAVRPSRFPTFFCTLPSLNAAYRWLCQRSETEALHVTRSDFGRPRSSTDTDTGCQLPGLIGILSLVTNLCYLNQHPPAPLLTRTFVSSSTVALVLLSVAPT
jgi:hypothetical protein